MIEIRKIEDEKGIEDYRKLAKYCFIDTGGWTDRFIPPKNKKDSIWGLFEDKNLASAMTLKHYESNLFGEKVNLAGISAVVSSPESRNKGYVKELFKNILPYLRNDDYLASALYPFKHSYYNKFGYGSIGGMNDFIFPPSNIELQSKDYFTARKIANNNDFKKDVSNIFNQWISQYNFGIYFTDDSIDVFFENIENNKSQAFMFYDTNNIPKGFVTYKLNPEKMFSSKIEIEKIAWLDSDALVAILNFLAKHRDQCHEIRFQSPKNIPLWLLLKEARPTQSVYYQWMARPVNVIKTLEMKSRDINFKGHVTFSIIDDYIPENTGTYHIIGYKVVKKENSEENLIPFHLFSSLLYGEISLVEVINFSPLKIQFSEDAKILFSKSNNIYLSEFF